MRTSKPSILETLIDPAELTSSDMYGKICVNKVKKAPDLRHPMADDCILVMLGDRRVDQGVGGDESLGRGWREGAGKARWNAKLGP